MSLPVTSIAVRHIVSGDVIFTAAVCILLGSIWRRYRLIGGERIVGMLFLMSGILTVASATPFPMAWNIALFLVSIGWLIYAKGVKEKTDQLSTADTSSNRRMTRAGWGDMLLALVWGIAILVVANWRTLPEVRTKAVSRLIVLGDSLSAGIDDGQVITWPELLRQQHHLNVIDESRAGATIDSAIQRINTKAIPSGLILIELGGNDVLGTTTPDEFQRNLERLLQKLSDGDNKIIMFELPLPPLGNRFGQAQRALAKKYNVALIPKRILASVLISPETTVDSIHLNQTGQNRLAEAVWRVVSGSAVDSGLD